MASNADAGNVDRQWDLWRTAPASPAHKDPIDALWQGQWYNFAAPDGRPVSVSSADTVDVSKVNVVYDPCPAAEAVARRSDQEKSMEFRAVGEPVTMGAEVRRRAEVAEAAGPYSGDEIQVTEMRFSPEVTMRLRVFVNKPDANVSTSLTDPHYAGTIFVVAAGGPEREGHDGAGHGPHSFLLPVTTKATSDLRGDATVKLTLVPVVARGRKSAEVVPGGVTIRAGSATVLTRP